MFENILKKLEDPTRPFLGPNVKALKFWGFLTPENTIKKCWHVVVYVLVFNFVVTEYVDIWDIGDDINLVINNTRVTIQATLGAYKVITFWIWQKKWKSIINYVTKTDLIHRNSNDIININIITKYTKYCRKITYLFWLLVFTTGLVLIFTPLFKFILSATYRENLKNGTEDYTPVVSSWVPFDKSTLPGYLAASAYQTYGTILGGGWITSFDTSAIVIMMFFQMELELLRRDSSNIYGTETQPTTNDEATERLKDCHKRHVELVKFARLFDSCLSPIMFVYLFICSAMLCVTAYQITSETSVAGIILTAEYLVFSVAQLYFYCWHGNQVWYASQDLSLGPYESTWWSTDVKKRKDVYILVAQFREVIVFNAGPFVQLTVATFISILKGAYSYYTLLSQSQMK